MGIFGYNCSVCGGCENVCRNPKHKNCNGGQFCYDENVVIVVDDGNGKIKMKGKYNGYGVVKVENGNIYIPSQFNRYIDIWGVMLNYDWRKTKISIKCSYCS